MVTPKCEQCRRVIPGEDINVANDVAYCRACNVSYALSELTHGGEEETAPVDLSRPPTGAWFRNDGLWRTIGASHRSWASAAGLLFFCLFWNGIVSVFVLLAIAATLKHLGVTAPEWFPAPKMNGDSMPVGMTIFLWLFLTPFIVIGLGMFFAFLSALGGRTEVRLRGSEGVVFTGIGPLGWRRRFVAGDVKKIRIADESYTTSKGSRQNKVSIVLELREGKPIKFGSGLTDERRAFVAAALRRELPNRL